MDDSFIITNFHALCRLCLSKSGLTTSIFGTAPDDDANMTLTSKIAECFELRVSIYVKLNYYRYYYIYSRHTLIDFLHFVSDGS